MHTIDNDARVIYDYGQSAQKFLDSLEIFGTQNASASFVLADGRPIADDDITDSTLRVSAKGFWPVDYKVAEGTDEDLLSFTNINENSIYNPDYRGWYEYDQPGSIAEGSALDASFLLDAPAGKHGFVERQGEDFVFKDTGGEIEFWGTNIGGTEIFGMQDDTYKTEAAKLAGRVAAAGFNLVRFHNLDGTSPHIKDIFGNLNPGWDNGWYERSSGSALDPVQMDKLCYLINELKERGVYYWIDQTCSRRVFPDDGIDAFGIGAGLKGPAYYNEKAIDIQKNFSEMLLTYPNPYMGGMTLAEDPAMAMIGLNNEFSISSYDLKTKMDDPALDDDYYDELCQKFSAWLLKKYQTRAALEAGWGTRQAERYSWDLGLQSGESLPSGGTPGYVEVFQGPGDKYYSRSCYSAARCSDVEKFFADIMRAYYTERIQHLRSMGVQCAITGSTAFSAVQPPAFYSNTQTDFIDVHLYRGHPQGGWDLNTKGLYIFEEEKTSVLETDKLGLIGDLAAWRVYGYPYVISEWNICPPNQYIAEGTLLMSAYASLGGWHPIQFAYTSDAAHFENVDNGYALPLKTTFPGLENPLVSAAHPASAIVFLRNDITEAQTGYYNVIEEEDIHVGMDAGRNIWPDSYPFPQTGYRGLLGKSGVAFHTEGKSDGLANDEVLKANADGIYNGSGDKVYDSFTGELSADLTKGVFKLNTRRSQAVCGLIGGKTITLDSVELTVENSYAVMTVTSLTDSDIEDSERILLTAIGRGQNFAQLMSEEGTTILKPGRAPIMVEQITGDVSLKLSSPAAYTVYSLHSDGSRKTELHTAAEGNGISFKITDAAESMHFEIVKE